jgi:TRAP-type C4-dicarboxylate transport system substrate-binding protein
MALGSRIGIWRWLLAVVSIGAAAGQALAQGATAAPSVPSVAPTAAAAAASKSPSQRLRVVGGLAGVNQYVRHEAPFWKNELPRLTGGRLSADIVPFDQAGIRGQEMLRLIQLGVVPFGTVLLSQASTQEPLLAAPDLPGLNPDMTSLRRNVASFRPVMESVLRQRYGIELLAVYAYPAQAVFCAKPIASLADLAGRRVRTAGAAQADFVDALGGRPVQAAFADLVPQFRSGNLDCAITGTMSANSLGLHELTSHVHSMAIGWGLSVFVANANAWSALEPGWRATLRPQLGKLEADIWAESERETGEGLACNTGNAACVQGRKGAMTEVKPTPADERRRADVFTDVVLQRWVQRCGAACVPLWNQTLGASTGVQARTR